MDGKYEDSRHPKEVIFVRNLQEDLLRREMCIRDRLLAFGIGALLNLLSLLIMKPYFGAFTNNEEIYQLSMAYMSVCSFCLLYTSVVVMQIFEKIKERLLKWTID